MSQSQGAQTAPAMPDQNVVSPELRRNVTAASIIPLWESGTTAFVQGAEQPFHWPWRVMQPIMRETATITIPAILERRVMMMVNPTIPRNDAECCSGLLSAGIQALMPGEVARPHRHSMHALRFVLEGDGGETIVEGKHCAMLPGDLVVTPGWTWHEHHNPQGTPTLWVDILDLAIHRALRNDKFQPGPPQGMKYVAPDRAFAGGGLVPAGAEGASANYSPIFRYAAEDANRAVDAAPAGPDGARLARYVNPVTGGPVLPTIDCYLMRLEQGPATAPLHSSGSRVCVVVDGEGESSIGETRISWGPKDVFTIPDGRPVSHRCLTGPARIFMANDGVIHDRLQLGTRT